MLARRTFRNTVMRTLNLSPRHVVSHVNGSVTIVSTEVGVDALRRDVLALPVPFNDQLTTLRQGQNGRLAFVTVTTDTMVAQAINGTTRRTNTRAVRHAAPVVRTTIHAVAQDIPVTDDDVVALAAAGLAPEDSER